MDKSRRNKVILYDAGLGGLAIVSGCVGVVAAVVIVVVVAKLVTKKLQNNFDEKFMEEKKKKEQMEMDLWVKDQIAKMEREKREQQNRDVTVDGKDSGYGG